MSDVKSLDINGVSYGIKAQSVVDKGGGKLECWTGTKAQYEAIATKDNKTYYTCADTGEIYLGDTQLGGGSGYEVGDIVIRNTPTNDAGKHLLDGALIQYGSYQAFVDYIAGLVADYPDLFVTESDWQTSVTTYGVCGKFVYDSVNNTVRLPKYNSKIYTGGGTAPVAGNGKGLGLTDGTVSGSFGNYSAGYNASYYNATLGSDVGSSYSPIPSAGTKVIGVVTDGSKSGLIAQLSNITTSLDSYYYIVIATSTKTDIQVDIDEIATDLNGKADVDLTNVNNTGTSRSAGWAMPSDTYVDLTLGASGSTYTAPANGYFYANFTGTNNLSMFLENDRIAIGGSYPTNSLQNVWLPVRKGDRAKLFYNGSVAHFRFVYANGSESEA